WTAREAPPDGRAWNEGGELAPGAGRVGASPAARLPVLLTPSPAAARAAAGARARSARRGGAGVEPPARGRAPSARRRRPRRAARARRCRRRAARAADRVDALAALDGRLRGAGTRMGRARWDERRRRRL